MSYPDPPGRRIADTDLRSILERAAFVLYFGMVVGACGAVGLGLIAVFALHDVRALLGGLGGAALARLLHWQGYRAWHFLRWEDSMEPSDRRHVLSFDGAESPATESLEKLLGELDTLKEVDAGRDVWRIQEVRRAINTLFDKHPALRDELVSELQRHPELL